VWIETMLYSGYGRLFVVTPCTGVWIETATPASLGGDTTVTPCTGVWIETQLEKLGFLMMKGSLPARECGLKPFFV